MSADEPRQKLTRILDPLIDDLMSLSDDEVLAEFREDGFDPELAASEVAGELAAAMSTAGKKRLEAARAQLNSVKAFRHQPGVIGLSATEKDRILREFAANDRPLQQRLTLAARNGQGMTEDEVNSVLLDLVELGALDSEGKVL